MTNCYKCKKVEDTIDVGSLFATKILENSSNIEKPLFVALYGDLGAGKTAFVSGMAKVLTPDDYVCSPTYSLINKYEGNHDFYHLDLYRITSDDDLFSIGFYELFDDKQAIIACEWCENIPSSLPKSYYKVTILGQGDDEREITIEEVLN